MRTVSFSSLAIGQSFYIGSVRYTKQSIDTAAKHSPGSKFVNLSFGNSLMVKVDDSAQLNALRELVRAEQARTQALLDMQAQLPHMSPAAFDALRNCANVLAHSKDWRDISETHLAELLRTIEQA